jgi:hypothetical protein
MITGKDLINLGYKPNKLFKDAINYINNNGLTIEDIRTYMDSIQPNNMEIKYEYGFTSVNGIIKKVYTLKKLI